MKADCIPTVFICFLILIAGSGSGACGQRQDGPAFAGYFQRLFEEGSQLPVLRGTDRFDEVKRFPPRMSKFHPQAQKLVEAGGLNEIPFLRTQAAERSGDRRCLALLTLALMAEHEDARDALLNLAKVDSPFALLALSFMEPQHIKDVATELARDPAAYARYKVFPLLAACGGNDTLDWLRAHKLALRDTPATDAVINDLGVAIAVLEKKLRLPEERQRIWQESLLLLWRANRELPGFRGGNNHSISAQSLASRGISVPADVLEMQIRHGDLIAIALAGIQKEESLVGPLSEFASKGLWAGMVAVSLGQIGSDDSFRALAELLKPQDGASAAQGRGQILRSLQWECPTQSMVDFLETLCKDEQYKESWPAFRRVIDSINARLRPRDPARKPQDFLPRR